MGRIRKSDFVVMVVSHYYLLSLNCLYEVIEFMKDEDCRQKVLPVVLDSAKIFSPESRLKYVQRWEKRYQLLRTKASKSDLKNIVFVVEEMRLVDSVCKGIGEFMALISDTKHVTPDEMLRNGYKDILGLIGLGNFQQQYYSLMGMVAKAKDQMEANRWEEAYKVLKKVSTMVSHPMLELVYEKTGSHPLAPAHFFLGYICAQDLSRKKEAMEHYSKAIEMAPTDHLALDGRGQLYAEAGEHEKAIEDFTDAIQRRRDFTRAYNNRGISYFETNQNSKAIADYTMAIMLDPNHESGYINRGIAYAKKGRYKKAIKDYSKVISMKPGFVPAYKLRGESLYNQGFYAKAVADYSTAIELEPNSFVLYLGRAVALWHLGELKRAEEDCSKAIDLNPKCHHAYHNRAAMLEKMGRPVEARVDALKATLLGDVQGLTWLHKVLGIPEQEK
jgi:tetratricopeptide (TPR) repeat protein